jgi:phage baseplate assembly protein gpV
LSIQGALTVGGAATIGGDLTVTGKLTAASFKGNGAGLSNVTPRDGSITNAKLAQDAASLSKVSGGKMVVQGDSVAIRGRLEVKGVVKFQGSGSTTPGSTNWQPYEGTTGIYLDVDTSAGKFTTTPKYFTSLGGNSSHWATTGVTSIYTPSPTGFRVYVRWSDGSALTPEQANSLQWHVNWLGVEA